MTEQPSQPTKARPFRAHPLRRSKALLLCAVATPALILGAAELSAAVPLPKPRPVVHVSYAPAPKQIVPSNAARPLQAPKQLVARKPATPMAVAATSQTSQADRDALERVIELLGNRNVTEATQVRDGIADPLAQKLAEWLILRSEDNGLPAERYRAFINANPSWPSLNLFRRRGEAALWDDRREDQAVMSFFANDTPLSAKGKLVLARAMLDQGDRRNAEKYLREAWHSDPMTRDTEAAALDQFGALLTAGDHKARLDFLVFTDDTAGAMRSAERLGPAYVDIVKARAAINRKEEARAKALLDAVPAEVRGDPAYMFGRIQYLRRGDRIAEAADLMLKAPRDPARLGNLDEWWIERRLISRKLLDTGDYRTAYVIARDAALPNRDIYQTEQQFTAGWIALRFLHDPATALQHFVRIGVGSNNPTAIARAGYWQGRALEELGRTQEARAAYQSAAEQSTSYYGQLSRARLGLPQIALNAVPERSSRGSQYEVVRAVELLYALDERAYTIPMLADLGERADDAQALSALAEVAGRNGDAKGMMLVGKAALNRGYPFDFYAYPVSGIPKFEQIGPEVEKSVVYAIARQESQFDQSEVSPAKAYGILQVTPEAGKYVTRKYGATYDQKRLATDASYNATLGAAELGGLLQDYRGSYIMTFAGYNAGRGRVKEWIERYGDPRDPSVDPIDWVERIPFSETRNYVQRVMENLQVYRSRFGGGSRLLIEADLRRGGGSGEN